SELEAGLPRRRIQRALEIVTVLVERVGERPKEPANRLLLCPPFGLLLRSRGPFLLRLRQRLERLLLLEPRDAVAPRLEVQSQRPLDGDLPEPEMRGGEDLADDDLFPLPVLRHDAGVAVLAVAPDLYDVL